MKILIYSYAFPPLIGGTETIVMLLAQGLSQLSCLDPGEVLKITVATPTAGDGEMDNHLPFRVVRKPSPKLLFQMIRDADVMHVAGPSLLPMVMGRLMRKRIVVEHHGFQTICPNGQLLHEPTQDQCPGYFMAKKYQECIRCNSKLGRASSLKLWLLTFPRRWLCQYNSANIFPTEWLGKMLQLNRGITIHHGIPESGISLSEIEPLIPTFVFVGRLVSTKGAQVFLRAAGLLRDSGEMFRVKIIGEGPDREPLEKLVRELELRDYVEFSGYCSPKLLNETLAQTTALVVPSLAGEVFGLVVLENMLRKKCLIVSDIPSLHEVIRDTGLLFPAGDAKALAACMRKILELPSLANRLGVAARERARQFFPVERMLTEHLAVYRRISVQARPDGHLP